MAHKVLTNGKIWLAQYDLSADVNALACEYTAAAVDDTNFGDTSEVLLGGVRSTVIEASGRWDQANADTALFNRVGTTDVPVSFALDDGAEGEVGYSLRALEASYSPRGEHGELFGFDATARGTDELVRGTVMLNATKTVAGTSTARELGAVSASQKVYAALHVISASGTSPTLDVVVRSDAASDMATPVSQITFTQATGATSEFLSAAGAITDTWWDISFTIGGTSPSFAFVVVVGIK